MSGVTTLAFRQELLKVRFLGYVPDWDGWEVCLTRKVPTTNADVSQLDEPVGLGYARQQYALQPSNFALINDNEVANTGSLYFPSATGSWGTLTGWAMKTYGGAVDQVMAVGTLNEPLRVVAGVRPYLGPGSFGFGLYDGA